MNGNLIALVLGILYSVIKNLGRCLQRMGIHSFDRLRSIFSKRTPKELKEGNHFLYISGHLLTNSGMFFVIMAARYGTISYFTAMYGIGMLPMLLFTRYVMKEEIHFRHWLGLIFIIVGSIFLCLAATDVQPVSMGQVKILNLSILLLLVTILSPLLIRWGKKKAGLFRDAATAGFISGMIASLDPVLKSAGQNLDNMGGFLPVNTTGWFFFLLSFAAATSAMFVAQYAYSRRVAASRILPFYNVAFIITPLLVQILILPGYSLQCPEAIGFVLIIIGIVVYSGKEITKLTSTKKTIH